MKRLFAILLALVLVLSLVACGGGGDDTIPSGEDKTPSSSQQEQQEDNGGEEQVAVDWPTADYISEAMKYTGEGTITYVPDEAEYAQTKYYDVYISGSSLEDVGNYLTALKAAGFEYFDSATLTSEGEPELAFDDFMEVNFEWRGRDADGHYLEIDLREETEDTFWRDMNFQDHPYSWNLKIRIFAVDWYDNWYANRSN